MAVRTVIILNDDEHKAFKEACHSKGVSMQGVLKALIGDVVDKRNKEKRKTESQG